MGEIKMSTKKNHNKLYIIAVIILTSLLLPWFGKVDNDYYFLKATGDVILQERQIPDTNPFFVVKDKPFVVQQWLWCVICSIIGQIGNVGILIIQIIQCLLIYLLTAKIYKVKFNNKEESSSVDSSLALPVFLISMWASAGLLINIRPEAITVILLLFQIYETEMFLKTKAIKHLMLLPICTLIEINVHASMWFMHFCVLIPYFLPFINKKARTTFKPFIAGLILMIGSLFINPVGMKAITFTFDSFAMGTFKIMKNEEIKTLFKSKDIYPFLILLIILGFAVCIKKKLLSAEEIYISSGIIILMVSAKKSVAFVPILSIYLFPHLNGLIKKGFDYKVAETFIQKYKIIFGTLISLSIGINFFSLGVTPITLDIYSSSIINYKIRDMAEKINVHIISQGNDKRVFTDYNLGGYLEMHGFRNCYIDARPESYAFPNTSAMEDSSILEEYSKLMCYYKEDDSISNLVNEGKTYSNEIIQFILDKYRFDYLIVPQNTILGHFLKENRAYINIDSGFVTIDDKMIYTIYRKK